MPRPKGAPLLGRESWLCRGEELASPLSVYAPALLAMYVLDEAVQRSESAEGRPWLDGADMSGGCGFGVVTWGGQGVVAWR
jgi:hypothetical protein